MGMKFIYYSHSDYSDVWPMMFGQAEKYLKDYDKVLFTDKGEVPEDWDILTYDDSLPYQQRVLSCLEQLDDEVVVFHHEDMFLYKEPDHEFLAEFARLVETDLVDFVKLLRGGYNDNLAKHTQENLVMSPPEMVFTIQPTICKTETLALMYRETPGDSIWAFESNTKETSIKHNLSGFMAFKDSDKKRGMHHYDSGVYPYVATGVVKGKWYVSDYPELKTILEEYGIDISIRGTV